LSQLRERIPGETILDDLTEQLDRTRKLLTSSPEEAAEAALASFAGQSEVEARIAADLAASQPLADPERFLAAHRLAVRALEVLDRDGSRNPQVSSRYGPVKPLIEFGVEFVAEYITKDYAESTANSIRRLYTRREPQAERGSAERLALSQARVEMERVANGFKGGGVSAPALVVGGAAFPLLASVSQLFGPLDFLSKPVLLSGLLIMFIVFGLLSSILLTGASIAHRRSTVIMRQPLAALWATIGHCGNPLQDDSWMFASIALMLSALVWVAVPAGALAVYFFA
jgi:hypothetical protein